MRSIEDVVTEVGGWSPDRSGERDLVVVKLDALATNCGKAIEVWQHYLDRPGTAGDRWTALSWVGPERAKTLHELSLRAGDLLRELLTVAGSDTIRFLAYENNMIETAYRQLSPGETGPDMARVSIDRMNASRAYLKSASDRVRSIVLAEARSGRKTSASAVRKSAGKKAAKTTPRKKAAPKKAAPKKAAPKKAAPKKAAPKKAAPKKAAPKKAAARRAKSRR